jgi:hypothetical protein
MAKPVAQLSTRVVLPPAPKIDPVIRNTKGLRQALFQEIDLIRSGRSTPTRANSVSKLAAGVLDSMRLEMEVERHKLKFLNQGGDDDETRVVDLGDGEEA